MKRIEVSLDGATPELLDQACDCGFEVVVLTTGDIQQTWSEIRERGMGHLVDWVTNR